MLVPDGARRPGACPPTARRGRSSSAGRSRSSRAFGDSDPVTRGADAVLQSLIPGAAGQPHVTLEGVAHFPQEDAGPRLAEIAIAAS